jgi:hypothetical protein
MTLSSPTWTKVGGSNNSVQITILTPLGVTTIQAGDVEIGPNPTSDKINIINKSNWNLQDFTIFNLDGVIIKESKPIDRTTILDIRDIPCGIYIGRLITNGGVIEQKIIIQK